MDINKQIKLKFLQFGGGIHFVLETNGSNTQNFTPVHHMLMVSVGGSFETSTTCNRLWHSCHYHSISFIKDMQNKDMLKERGSMKDVT